MLSRARAADAACACVPQTRLRVLNYQEHL